MSGKPKKKYEIKKVNKGWANLKPVQPGEVRNPHGRPPNPESITNLMREWGNTIGPDGRERKQALVEILWAKAQKGDPRVAEYIIDRLEGRPKERQEVTTPDSGLLVIVRHGSGGNGDGK